MKISLFFYLDIPMFFRIFTGIFFAIAVYSSAFAGEQAAKKSHYIVQELSEKDFSKPQIDLPDIQNYNLASLSKRIPTTKAGQISIQNFQNIGPFWVFYQEKMLKLFTQLQGKAPVAIVIQNGIYDLDMLTQSINDPEIISKSSSGYVLKRPLYISHSAALIVKDTTLQLAVSQGAFIVNSGDFYAVNAQISGWDTAQNAYASSKNNKDFRPFYLAWSGSQSFFGNTQFHSLGYSAPKAYGISLSTINPYLRKPADLAPPTGWIINCRFEDIYYGFYSYEAANVVILNNIYANNIVYGIDPHDRSYGLIIAQNEAFGTHKKHGIIVSRGVTKSWIFNNNSHHNHGSGIMLDRNSHHIVVAHNNTHENGFYGVALLESPDNIIAYNRIARNKKEGFKIRNSWNILGLDNSITDNGGIGVNLLKTDISNDKRRDFKRDPFAMRTGLTLQGGKIAYNKVDIGFSDIDEFRLSGIAFQPTPHSIQGNMSLSARNEALKLLQQKKSFAFVANQ